MTQTKIEGKFYPLKNDEWLAIAKKLTHSELLVLYHLRTLEPFGDKLTESSTKDVAAATGISQRSVQRALIKLADLELIDLHIQKFEFKLRSQHTTETTGSDSAVASTSPVSPTRQACREVVTAVANSSGVSRSQAETITTPDVQNSKTSKDLIKDFSKTLSEAEREIFNSFCLQAAAAMPEQPTLISKWIDKNQEWLIKEFQLRAIDKSVSLQPDGTYQVEKYSDNSTAGENTHDW